MSNLPPFPLRADLRDRLGAVGNEFLREILSRETDQHPDNLAALAELAHVLTRMGRLEEGLATDERLAAMAPDDPTVQYNLACSFCLVGRTEAALDALEHAVELGYDDPDHLLADEDLRSIRSEPRFRTILESLRAHR